MMSNKIKVSPNVNTNSNKLSCNPVNNISVVVRPDESRKFRNVNIEQQQQTEVMYPSVKPQFEPPICPTGSGSQTFQSRDINLEDVQEETTTTGITCRDFQSLDAVRAQPDYKSEYISLKEAYDTLEYEKHKCENINSALNIIIGIMQDNPTYVNKLIIADDEKLSDVLTLLCEGAESVNIDADEIATCFAKAYRNVNTIYINVRDANGNIKTENLKYAFPDVCKYMKDLGINLKVVW